MNVGIVTGGFDPLHSGHLSYIKAAKQNCDVLVVGLNSDDWLIRKKGKFFLPFSERSAILSAISEVNLVVDYDDADGSSFGAIEKVWEMFPGASINFMNGGDRTSYNIPEQDKTIARQDMNNVMFTFAIGGDDKKNSSSWILKEWSQPSTETRWGSYTQLASGDGWMTKQLNILPGTSLSDQRHFFRSEHWQVVEGQLSMLLDGTEMLMNPGDSVDIEAKEWHQAVNNGGKTVVAIETWRGSDLREDDIERRNMNAS